MLSRKDIRNHPSWNRAFILGNGPSIKTLDLSLLHGELAIGVNATTVLEKEGGFTQSYYCVSDSRFLNSPEKRRYATTDLRPETIRVFRDDLFPDDDPQMQRTTFYTRSLGRDGFSPDITRGFYHGCSSAYLALQLAVTLDIREIYLLGVDLIYRPTQPRFYREEKPQIFDLFTSVQIWNFANACSILEGSGISLFVCSPGSLLRPYIPFADYIDLFNGR